MSDKTPAGAAENDGEPQESVEPTPQQETEDTSAEAVSDDGGADAVDDGEPAITRKTAAAPKRRKKNVSTSDDEKIAALEEGFTPEEQASAGQIRRRAVNAPVKKQAATRKQESTQSDSEDADPYATKNPLTFTKQSAGELKKVVWPTGKELRTYFIAVLVFVLFVIAYVGLLDLLFGWGLLSLLGD